MNKTIGFIGQGWIGKNYADDFESRGLTVVRYSLEDPHIGNKDKIEHCDIVFIAVPTPTTKDGFDSSYVEAVLPLVGSKKTAVLKSTVLPGTTNALQEKFPDIFVLNSPEFLREANAAYDAAHPERNIIGIPVDNDDYREKAKEVLAVLAKAPYESILKAESAELVKYAGNTFLATKVVFANILADYAQALNVPYEEVAQALGSDPRIGLSHLQVMSASGHTQKVGRGAGGHCFIKDLEAFRRQYKDLTGDTRGSELLSTLIHKNNALLVASGKDLDLLTEVYGENYDVLS